MDKLSDYIQLYDGVISEENCKKLIDEYEAHASTVENHDTPLYKFHQLNLNQTPGLGMLAQAVGGSLYPCFEDYFTRLNLKQFVEINTWEDIRIKKYLKGTDDQFRMHVDVTDHASAARFAIAILYLNDNNGLTTFDTLGLAVKPEAGRVVIFPATWMFPHSGKPSTDNDKYIMMTALHYK